MKEIKLLLIVSILFMTSCKNDIKPEKKIKEKITQKTEPKKKIFNYESYIDSKSLKKLKRYEYLESKNWNSNQIYKTELNNKVINTYTISSLPVKIEILENIGDVNKKLIFYLNEKIKLDFVIEKEYSKTTSEILSENHYYFTSPLKLYKKIINQDINTEISNEEIEEDEIRIKNIFSNYLGEIAFKIQSGK
ncbi:hypothetical protein [Tenacibaculum maritimum]|uniref:hypothetical protein n=6 Tax=Tenacibaculum maritimum TaxID=107401 RepID=UPI0012E62FEE|nr:hypothetical protein [Tenacibaculum maritimum]CAA0183116.1 hypothetical protein JIP1097_190049 [Tenacibaculum maritimum]CAA0253166.1 hypothetical protein TMP139_880001 [Tenacibaculum maritimum]